MSLGAHVQALHDAIRADHEEWVAEIQAWTDEAAARGDDDAERRHLAHVDQLQALPRPWEDEPT